MNLRAPARSRAPAEVPMSPKPSALLANYKLIDAPLAKIADSVDLCATGSARFGRGRVSTRPAPPLRKREAGPPEE